MLLFSQVDVGAAAHHVSDAPYFEFPFGYKLFLPAFDLFGYHFQVTKYMALELVVAVLMLLVFVPLAYRLRSGQPVRGRIGNMLEAILVFIRDDVARPAIGHHDADRFLPFLWTVFFFILLSNLIGLIPWAGSPTGSINVTATLALCTFAVVIGAGLAKLGPAGWVKSFVPHMDLPKPLAIMLIPMIFVIEVMGLLIKHTILAVRLLANMFAGHLVLGVILGFVGATAGSWLWFGVTPASVLGAVGLSLLELLVAFLQAYIFTFLSALFIGMAVHPH